MTKTKVEENLCIPETQRKCMNESVIVCRLKLYLSANLVPVLFPMLVLGQSIMYNGKQKNKLPGSSGRKSPSTTRDRHRCFTPGSEINWHTIIGSIL